MLGKWNANATIAVKDLNTANRFYEEILGLEQRDRNHEGITYKSGNSSVLVYVSKFAGTNKATAVTWIVDDVEEVVRSLGEKGVRFEHYDFPDTTRHGDVHVSGDIKVAWFKDPDGNIIGLTNQSSMNREKQPRTQRSAEEPSDRVLA
jgi:catechol 2,3-dioxygenase-like lactoylglutathione lyase family enzyme